MTMLSNSLTDLADRVREANHQALAAERTSVQKALEAGRLLIEAKDSCPHGEWLPFLKRADVAERQCQRLMQLARSGLKSAQVSDLGGIKATLEWLSQIRLPAADCVLFVDVAPTDNIERGPHVYVWPVPEGYRAVMFDLNEAAPHTKATFKPVKGFSGVLLTICQMLEFRLPQMTFYHLDKRVASQIMDDPIMRQFLGRMEVSS